MFLFLNRTARDVIEIFPLDLILEGFDYLFLMADQQKRASVLLTQFFEERQCFLPIFRIQVPCGFIRKNKFGPVGQRPCDHREQIITMALIQIDL